MSSLGDLKIIYADGSVVIADKPSGVDSEKELPALALDALGSSEMGGELYTVHRLDRMTSGLIVLARTKKAAASLSDAIASGRVEKRYVALVGGIPAPPSGEMEDLLFFDRQKGRSYPVSRKRKGVKEAKLAYTTVSSDAKKGESLVSVRLYTGRTHQIRVQFASRGMPLCGDGRYGSREPPERFFLRSVSLSFPHPDTGKTLEFSLEYPTDLNYFN